MSWSLVLGYINKCFKLILINYTFLFFRTVKTVQQIANHVKAPQIAQVAMKDIMFLKERANYIATFQPTGIQL